MVAQFDLETEVNSQIRSFEKIHSPTFAESCFHAPNPLGLKLGKYIDF